MNSKKKAGGGPSVENAESPDLAELMNTMAWLADGVSHEINNYLTPLRGYGGVLEHELRDRPQALEFLRPMLAEIETLVIFAEQLQGLSNTSPPRMVPVSVNTVVRNLVPQLMDELVKKRGTKVRLEIDLCDEDIYILADDVRLQRLARHLVYNGSEAMPAGGKVVLRTRKEADGRVVLEAADEGVGIGPAERPHLFKPYYPLYGQKSGKKNLWVLHVLTHQCGGSVVWETQPGKGSTFRLIFPRADRPPQMVFEGGGSAHPFRVPMLLVVEPDEDLRRTLTKALKDQGFRPLAAGSVAEARGLCDALTDPIRVVVCAAGLIQKRGFGPGALPAPHQGARWVSMGGAGAEGDVLSVEGKDPAAVAAAARRAAGL